MNASVPEGRELENIVREFNALAPVYESNRLSGWYRAHADELLRLCPKLTEGRVLDVGCATGEFLRRYLKDKPGVTGVGIDIAPSMIDVAEKKAADAGLDRVKFVAGNWERLNREALAAQRFNLIVCASTFHYFSGPDAAARQLFDRLEPGGRLFVVERDQSGSPLTWLWGLLHRSVIKDHVRFYRRDQLLDCFKSAGFSQVQVAGAIKRYFWKGKLFTSVVLIECQK